MNTSGVKFEVLARENYDTWKLQMRAIFIKNDEWGYVDGTFTKPEIVDGDAEMTEAARRWIAADLKAQSDIVLAIHPSELKQIKNCKTAREIWTKLENIYMSKGPARKVSLLNHLMSLKMLDGDDAREHSRRFSDTVDKLSELGVEINNDLLVVMLMRSLPENFENFRCAMSSRDELPSLETLYIKIAEEYDARGAANRKPVQNAMTAGKSRTNNKHFQTNRYEKWTDDKIAKSDSQLKCFKCRKIGHRAKNCKENKRTKEQSANCAKNVCLFTVSNNIEKPFNRAKDNAVGQDWCLDRVALRICARISDHFISSIITVRTGS